MVGRDRCRSPEGENHSVHSVKTEGESPVDVRGTFVQYRCTVVPLSLLHSATVGGFGSNPGGTEEGPVVPGRSDEGPKEVDMDLLGIILGSG